MFVENEELEICRDKLLGCMPYSQVILSDICTHLQRCGSSTRKLYVDTWPDFTCVIGLPFSPSDEELEICRDKLQECMPYSHVMLSDICIHLQHWGSSTRKFYVDTWPEFTCMIGLPFSPSDPVQFEAFAEVTCYARDAAAMTAVLQIEGLIPWNRKFAFGGFQVEFFDGLKEVMEKCTTQEIERNAITPCNGYTILHEKDIPTFNPPEDLIIDKLTLADSQQVNREWDISKIKHDSELYVSWLIENRPSMAVREKNGTLIAYELTHYPGEFGVLYVKPQHRGKGIAKYLVAEMARSRIKTGHDAFVFISEENILSKDIHIKCGFKRVENYMIFWQYNTGAV